VNLPYLGEPLILTVKVCNDYNVCDKYEDPNPIVVTMPDKFTVDDIRCVQLYCSGLWDSNPGLLFPRRMR
jgi:hypothetical protein